MTETTQTAKQPRLLAAELRQAARLMRERAKAATPGPWERPLDTRYKNVVIAALPEDEEPRSWKGGIIPADMASQKGPTGRYAGQRERVAVVSASAGMDGFDRKRNGRDLEYIAGMDPGVALAVADWLDREAEATELVASDRDEPDAATVLDLPDSKALAVARAYLGTAEGPPS